MKFWTATLAAIAMLIPAVPATAHHSFGMFDISKRLTIEGVVKDFQFVNPHSVFVLTVKEPGGNATTDWWIETNSLVVLKRQGWTRRSVKPGDTAVLVVNPLREGRPGGNLVQATINGKLVGQAMAAPAPAATAN